MLDKYISSYILPSQHSVPKKVKLEIANKGNSDFTNLMVPTRDGAQLDTLIIKPQNLANDAPYVIYFCGMRGCYTRKIDKYRERAEKYGHIAVCFNYRNVGNSIGTIYSQTQLIDDGKAQVERLLKLNIPANKITLYGLSLGGAIATIVVADYQKNGSRIRLINDRSFTKLIDALPPSLQKINFLVWLLAKSTNWELNAMTAMKFINKEDVLIICAKEDKLIAFNQASIFKALNLEKAYKTCEVANGKLLNESKGDATDPESKYGVHGALLEKLLDKNNTPIIDSVYDFVKNPIEASPDNAPSLTIRI